MNLVFVSATRVRNKKNKMKGRKSMGSCTKGHEEGANRKNKTQTLRTLKFGLTRSPETSVSE